MLKSQPTIRMHGMREGEVRLNNRHARMSSCSVKKNEAVSCAPCHPAVDSAVVEISYQKLFSLAFHANSDADFAAECPPQGTRSTHT